MSHRSHILVVEDDPDMSEVIVWALQQARYEAVAAANGRQALESVAVRMPSLILLDMLMPVMDGWQFASELRARYGRPPPIIVVTAAEQTERRAQEIGADDWLSKPFELRDLLHAVARFCPLPEAPEHWGMIGR
jgi:DNA-binding response OmpR family regulator